MNRAGDHPCLYRTDPAHGDAAGGPLHEATLKRMAWDPGTGFVHCSIGATRPSRDHNSRTDGSVPQALMILSRPNQIGSKATFLSRVLSIG